MDKFQLNPASSRERLHRSAGLTKEQLVVSISPRLMRGFSEPFRLSGCSTFSNFNSTPLGNEDGLEIVALDRRLRRHLSIAPRYSARIPTTPHVVANGFDIFQSHPVKPGTATKSCNWRTKSTTSFNFTPLKRGPQRNHKSLRHLLGILSIPHPARSEDRNSLE